MRACATPRTLAAPAPAPPPPPEGASEARGRKYINASPFFCTFVVYCVSFLSGAYISVVCDAASKRKEGRAGADSARDGGGAVYLEAASDGRTHARGAASGRG